MTDGRPSGNLDWFTMDLKRSIHARRTLCLGPEHLARQSIVWSAMELAGSGTTPWRPIVCCGWSPGTSARNWRRLEAPCPSPLHRRAMFVFLLPAGLEFLETRTLLNAAIPDTIYQPLGPIRRDVSDTLQKFSPIPPGARRRERVGAGR